VFLSKFGKILSLIYRILDSSEGLSNSLESSNDSGRWLTLRFYRIEYFRLALKR
jgi:hypothetical protein